MTEDSNGGDRKVRLTPPPRVTRPAHRRPAREGGVPLWLTVVVLAVLGTAAFAVFVQLPRWVEARDSQIARPSAELEAPLDPLPAEADDPTALVEAALGSREDVPTVNAPMENDATEEGPIEDGPTQDGPARRSAPTESGELGGGVPPDPADGAFRAAMTEGLGALDRGDWAAAREALERARSIRPDAPEVTDGLARVRAGETLVRIAGLREEARGHEDAERWRQAADTYRAVLDLDDAIAFAREGHARATARAELAETLDRHLAHPERLSSEAVRDEVAALVDRAREIEPVGPRHRRQIDELSRLVSEWSRPVTAELVSDARTRVTVYRVGRLGTFERRELELRPGTYAVVGHRDGYRDVRMELVIRPGETPEPLRVVCEEEI